MTEKRARGFVPLHIRIRDGLRGLRTSVARPVEHALRAELALRDAEWARERAAMSARLHALETAYGARLQQDQVAAAAEEPKGALERQRLDVLEAAVAALVVSPPPPPPWSGEALTPAMLDAVLRRALELSR